MMALLDVFRRKKSANYDAQVGSGTGDTTDELSRFRQEMMEARRARAGKEGELPGLSEVPEGFGGDLVPPARGPPGHGARRARDEPAIKEMEEFTIPPRMPPPIAPPALGRPAFEGPPALGAEPERPPWERTPERPARAEVSERPPHIHLESDRLDLILSKLDTIDARLKLIEEKLKRF